VRLTAGGVCESETGPYPPGPQRRLRSEVSWSSILTPLPSLPGKVKPGKSKYVAEVDSIHTPLPLPVPGLGKSDMKWEGGDRIGGLRLGKRCQTERALRAYSGCSGERWEHKEFRGGRCVLQGRENRACQT